MKLLARLAMFLFKYSAIQIGTLANIPIKFDIGLLFVISVLAIDGLYREGFSGLFYSTIYALFLYLSIFAHELGHALVAKNLGILPTEIQIRPLFGLTNFKEEAPPKKSIIICAAGPATNLLLALLTLIPVHFFGGWTAIVATYNNKTLLVPSLGNFCIFLFLLNLTLGLFNLLPVYPFDGGRIMQSTFLLFLPKNRALHLSAVVTQVVAFPIFLWSCWTFNLLTAFFMGLVFGFARIQRKANPWNINP